MYSKVWILLIYLQCYFCTHTDYLTQGNEFYLTFMSEESAIQPPNVVLFNPNNFDVVVNLSCTAIGFGTNVTVSKNSQLEKALTTDLYYKRFNTETTDKVLIARINDNLGNIYVKSLTNYTGHTQVYDVIPKTFLSTNYVVGMACPNKFYFVHVIWTDSTNNGYANLKLYSANTNAILVTYNSYSYKSGDNLSIYFGGVKAAVIYSEYDLTGTTITSQHQVAVFSGCDSESLVNYYQTKQAVPSVTIMGGYYFSRHYFIVSQTYQHAVRVIKVTNLTTTVTMEHDRCHFSNLTDTNPWNQMNVMTPTAEIFSDNPIAVLHILSGSMYPPVFFYYAISVDDFTESYQVTVPTSLETYVKNTTLFIDYVDGSGSDIRIDGNQLPSNAVWNSYDNRTAISATTFALSKNTFVINQTNYIRFHGYVYGTMVITDVFFMLPLPSMANPVLRTCVGNESEEISGCIQSSPETCEAAEQLGTSTLQITNTVSSTSASTTDPTTSTGSTTSTTTTDSTTSTASTTPSATTDPTTSAGSTTSAATTDSTTSTASTTPSATTDPTTSAGSTASAATTDSTTSTASTTPSATTDPTTSAGSTTSAATTDSTTSTTSTTTDQTTSTASTTPAATTDSTTSTASTTTDPTTSTASTTSAITMDLTASTGSTTPATATDSTTSTASTTSATTTDSTTSTASTTSATIMDLTTSTGSTTSATTTDSTTSTATTTPSATTDPTTSAGSTTSATTTDSTTSTASTTPAATTDSTTSTSSTTSDPTTSNASTTPATTTDTSTNTGSTFTTTTGSLINTGTHTTSTTTTSTSSTTTTTTAPCACNCLHDFGPVNMTEELLEQLEEIKKELTVEKSTLSSVIRTKISADDPRPSAKFVGSLGIAMLTITFGGIILSDVSVLYAAFKSLIGKP